MSVITAAYPHAIAIDDDYINDSMYGYSAALGRATATPIASAGGALPGKINSPRSSTPGCHGSGAWRGGLHGEDLADDAVQEALLSLWKEGRMPQNPEGWLVRAVVHRSLHLNRSRRRRAVTRGGLAPPAPSSIRPAMRCRCSKPRKLRMRSRRCSESYPNNFAQCSCSARPSSATTSRSPRRSASR